MVKLPRAEAESLAAELVEQLLPHIQRALVELLIEPDPDELSARDHAKVKRALASWRRKMERAPQKRVVRAPGRKAG